MVGVLVKQKIIQFQRKERLETELLQTITTSSEKIYWVNLGKEVLIEGELFDVKSFKTQGEKIFLTGIFDKEEDNLLREMDNFTQQKNEPNNPINQLAFKFIFAPVYKESVLFSLQNSWHTVFMQFSTYAEVILKGYYAIAIHPPEYC
ncbi:MAG: hypothetical protein ABI666_07620 [Ferruginibacter sp.]